MSSSPHQQAFRIYQIIPSPHLAWFPLLLHARLSKLSAQCHAPPIPARSSTADVRRDITRCNNSPCHNQNQTWAHQPAKQLNTNAHVKPHNTPYSHHIAIRKSPFADHLLAIDKLPPSRPQQRGAVQREPTHTRRRRDRASCRSPLCQPFPRTNSTSGIPVLLIRFGANDLRSSPALPTTS